jgi:hypothetical protein
MVQKHYLSPIAWSATRDLEEWSSRPAAQEKAPSLAGRYRSVLQSYGFVRRAFTISHDFAAKRPGMHLAAELL